AIAGIAALSGDSNTANEFEEKADVIKKNLQEKCWDSTRQFFYHRYEKDEAGGIKANTLTYQTGKYAGNPHGREEIGFIPWYYNLPDTGYEAAWKFLMDPAYFYSPYGPTTVEKGDPMFDVSPYCCAWSGNSWPFATSQTLKAMSNLLRNYKQDYVTDEDYIRLLHNYASSQVKNDTPFIGEANNPETGSWSGHDYIGHSEHYFHSSYIDLIIDGLMGLEASAGDSLVVDPLIPKEWDYACLDNVRYHGSDISIVWDRTGTKYNKGKGLLVFVDGQLAASAPSVKKLVIFMKPQPDQPAAAEWNYAVNNEPDSYYPHISTSFPGTGASTGNKMNDGQYWYLSTTPNRWSSQYSKEKKQTIDVDFGTPRPIHTVKIYFVEDSEAGIRMPESYLLQYFDNGKWSDVPKQTRQYTQPQANRANAVTFPELKTSRLRLVLNTNSAVAISEIEAWGAPTENYNVPAAPETVKRNLVFRNNAVFSTSYKSKVDDVTGINDGNLNRDPRWTAWKSPNATDWVQFDFKKPQLISKVYLYIFSDNGDIAPPSSYQLQYWSGGAWKNVENASKLPATPIADLNICEFKPVTTGKL
ncbi:MAG: discoidin domain-containing protein, partial [Mucilaginibacter polytrichastri]|nr:discoidin domain-containing protein [Mucilaginibacter polytrichastri]